MTKIFGTDGVRGKANQYPLTADHVLRLAQAAGHHFRRGGHRHRAVIGKDTRRSGYMLENALVAGLTSVGMDVVLCGPLPTPAVGILTRSLRADLGIMISASHNPFHDNGIKFFGPDGFKLSDADEARIDALLSEGMPLAEPEEIGSAQRIDGAAERYMEFAKRAFPSALRLDGLKVVVDAANGAAYRTAPGVIWELGAEVIMIGNEPDGLNINRNCGSTSPAACAAAVLRHGADLGIALDGDADRVCLIDENGRLSDGDQIMALIASRFADQGTLKGGAIVATIMSNLGLERHLSDKGIKLERTAVGDRNVIERMRDSGCNVGGEQSGHLILSDYATTGDGLIAALQAMAMMVEEGRPASQVLRRFEPVPQILRSVQIRRGSSVMERPDIQSAIAQAHGDLGPRSRLVIRPSGTEPLIRIMVEGEDEPLLQRVVGDLCHSFSYPFLATV
jgi:phosphoglucosamine mutase